MKLPDLSATLWFGVLLLAWAKFVDILCWIGTHVTIKVTW